MEIGGTMLQLKEGAAVFTSGGKQVGEIDRFVLDPATQEVTHIVVKKGWLLPEDKVIPMSMVRSATADRVVLNDDVPDFDKLPPFEARHFVDALDYENRKQADTGVRPAYYWYPPLGHTGYPAFGLGSYAWPLIEVRRNIPKDAVPLKEGSDVISSDGKHVGHVERLYLETGSNKVTHLLVSHSLLPDRKLIPASWVKSVEEHSVHLSVPAGVLRGLPPEREQLVPPENEP
jgi:sporulation protein YlmC with PRC-barrel domain